MTNNHNLSVEQVQLVGNACTTLAMLDHYLKHGTIADRKMAARARKSCDELQQIIDKDLLKRQVQAI